MLTKEILKSQLGGIQGKMDFSTLEPFAKFAERWFREQAGQELTDFVAENLTLADDSGESDVVDLALACMSWRCYELAFPHLKLRASDLGLQKLNTTNAVAISKWEYVDSREANLAMLDLALENFWSTLEHVRPAAWIQSAAYQKRQKVWIRSATELAEFIPTLGRKSRLFEQLLTYIRRAEQIYIKPILTQPVFSGLKAAWSDPQHSLTSQEAELLEAIRPALAHMALYEAYPYLPLTLDINGISESRSKDGTLEQVAPGSEAKTGQKRQLYQDGQFYLSELDSYLKATATPTQWPGYYQTRLSTPADSGTDDFTNSSLIIL